MSIPMGTAVQKWDMTTRVDDKIKRDADEAKTWLAVCRHVDARDGMRCRACKRKLRAVMTLVADRRERHHVIPLSHGGSDANGNVCNICKRCHVLRHVKRTLHIAGNADGVLTFKLGGKTWQG